MKTALYYPIASIILLIGGTSARAQSSPKPSAQTEETVELSPFHVSTNKDRGYGSRESMGATRVALPATDVSASVVVLNENFLKDLAAASATEALQYVSGVKNADTNNSNRTFFSLRGYTAGITLRDGLPEALVSGGDIQRDDEAQYERIEVIKGPAGTLYGSTSVGGIVNMVSRWPKFQPRTSIETQFQTTERMIRGVLDSTGPLSKTTAYRFVISDSETERYYRKSSRSGMFTSNLSLLHNMNNGRGRLWTSFRFMRSNVYGGGQGPQFITGYLDPKRPGLAPVVSDPVIPVSNFESNGTKITGNRDNYRAYEAGYEQSFDALGGTWTLRLVGRFNGGKGDTDPSPANTIPVPVDANGRIVTYVNAAGITTNGDNRFISANDPQVVDWRSTLTYRHFHGWSRNGNIFADLIGDVTTGPVQHKILLSTNLGDATSERAFYFWNVLNPTNRTALANSFTLLGLDPYLATLDDATIKAQAPVQFNSLNGNAEVFRFNQGVQDNLMMFNKRLIVTLGARYDNAHFTNQVFDSAKSIATGKLISDPARTTLSTNSDFTYKYGVVYKVRPHLGVFGQVSQTFVPISTVNASGAKFPNQEGEMKEAGINAELMDGRFVATVSAFNITLSNVLVSVINPPSLGGGTTLQPAGVQFTRGYEMDLASEPIKGLQTVFAFSQLTSTNSGGFYFPNVAMGANWSLFGKYSFSGPLRNWSIGAGRKRLAKIPGDATNTWFLGRSDNVDAFIGYEHKRWGVQLKIYDALGSEDIITAGSDTSVYRNFRHYRATFRYEF